MGEVVVATTITSEWAVVTYATTPSDHVFLSFIDTERFEDLEDIAIMESAEAEAERNGWFSWDEVKRELDL